MAGSYFIEPRQIYICRGCQAICANLQSYLDHTYFCEAQKDLVLRRQKHLSFGVYKDDNTGSLPFGE
jgi:hypothetical protein